VCTHQKNVQKQSQLDSAEKVQYYEETDRDAAANGHPSHWGLEDFRVVS